MGHAVPLNLDTSKNYGVITDVDDTLIEGMVRNKPLCRLLTLSRLYNNLSGAVVLVTNSDMRSVDKMTSKIGKIFPAVSEHGCVERLNPKKKLYREPPITELIGMEEAVIETQIETLLRETSSVISPTYSGDDLDGQHLKIEVKETCMFLGYGIHQNLSEITLRLAQKVSERFNLESKYKIIEGKDGVELATRTQIDSNNVHKKAEAIPDILNSPLFKTRTPIIIGDTNSDIEMMEKAAYHTDYVGIFIGQRNASHPDGLTYLDSIPHLWGLLKEITSKTEVNPSQHCLKRRALTAP